MLGDKGLASAPVVGEKRAAAAPSHLIVGASLAVSVSWRLQRRPRQDVPA